MRGHRARDEQQCGCKRSGGVAAALYDVDFAACGPSAVWVVSRQHPQCRPDPIALRQLRANLDASVLEAEALCGAQTSRLDGVDDVAAAARHALTSIECIARALIRRIGSPQINARAAHESRITEEIRSERRLEEQDAVAHERVGAIVGVILNTRGHTRGIRMR